MIANRRCWGAGGRSTRKRTCIRQGGRMWTPSGSRLLYTTEASPTSRRRPLLLQAPPTSPGFVTRRRSHTGRPDMSSPPPPPPQWVVDLNTTPSSRPRNPSLPDPPGYTASLTRKERAQSSKTARKPPTPDEMDTLKMKKAWEVAIAPAKQLPMNAFGSSYFNLSTRDAGKH